MILFTESKANHILGGDLTYSNIGPNQYLFTLTVYRDCSGNLLDPAYTLNYKSASCNLPTSSITVNKVGLPQEVSVTCPSRQNSCNGGGELGIQKQTYTGIITLPQSCNDWVISWDPGASSRRNSTIKNIVDAVNQNFYLEAKINNTVIKNNNSPVFSGMAFSYLFLNQKGTINSNATDIDGNELKYKNTTPKTGASTNVTYNTGFTSISPVSTSSTSTFNTTTGELTTTPTIIEQSVTAVVVEEYQDGIMIGSVMRDLQIITLDVNNINPIISGINNTSLDSLTACAGDIIDFNIYGSDSDINPTQKLSVTWDNGIPLNTGNGIDGFTTKGSNNNDTTNFKWKSNNSASGLYTFTMKISDDYCPIVGATVKTFKIRIHPKPTFNLGNDTTLNCTDTKLLTPFNLKGKAPYVYSWDNEASTNQINVFSGNYSLTITDANNCSYTDNISIKSGIVANFSIDSLCANSPSKFTDNSFSKSGSTITKWDWNFDDVASGINNTSLLQNPSHTFVSTRDISVKLKIEDEFGCKGDTTLNFHICEKPLPDFKIIDTCKRKPATMLDLTQVNGGCGIMKYEMTFVHQTTFKVETANYTFPIFPEYLPGQPDRKDLSKWLPADSGRYQVTMVATNENGCKNKVIKNVYIRPQPIVSLLEKDYHFKCNKPDTSLHILDTMTVKSKLPFNKFTWDPLKIVWSIPSNPPKIDSLTIHINKSGFYSVKVTDMFGCDSVESVDIDKTISPNIISRPYCKQGQQVKFIDKSTSNWLITSREWDFGDNNNIVLSGNDTTILNTKHLYASDNTYTVRYKITDSTTCSDTMSIKVLVNTLTNTFNASPSPVCVNSPINIKSRTGNYINNTNWNFGDGNTRFLLPAQMSTVGGKLVYNGTYSYTTFGTGNYDIILTTIYNDELCVIRDTSKITLFPELKINLADPIGLCANLPTQINATRTSGNPVTKWTWGFHYKDSKFPFKDTLLDSLNIPVVDNIGKTLSGQRYTYTKGGNYFINLNVVNSDGCEVKFERKLFRILDLPVPNFCISDSCVTNPTKFYLFCGVKPEVSINKYEWNFGDGNKSAEKDTAIHIYNNVGTFPVSVTISDTNYRCSKSYSRNLSLKSVAFPVFKADTVCYKLNTTFIDKSTTIVGDTIINWKWKFGDGDSSNIQSPIHNYKNPGTYNVILSATNKGKNCTKDYNYPVIVRPNPIAGFTFDALNSTAQMPILFTDSSSSDVQSWNYNFGDNTANSTDKNAVHSFKNPGVYQIKQEVTNQYGCKDDITKPLDLNIYLIFPDIFSPNKDGLNDIFHPITRGVQKIDEIKLYNRWGELIWETSGEMDEKWNWKDHSWDGTYNGEDQPIGVYVYYARAKSFVGDDIKIQGKVTIIR